MDATLEFFSTLRMARGVLVKAGEDRVKEICKTHQIKLLMPCRNPSKWNSLAARSLADVVKDIEQGSLPKCSNAFFSLTELCYKEAVDILRAGNMKYYNDELGAMSRFTLSEFWARCCSCNAKIVQIAGSSFA